jgi:hypothetical protein
MPLDSPKTRLHATVLSWTSSYWLVVLFALMIGIFAILSSFAFDRVMHGVIRPVYASDLLEGTVVALFSAAALLKIQGRRKELQTRMQIVEDVNHHVRNALSAVVLSAALRDDPELNQLVKDACDRIDWVLSDVLPQSVDGKDTGPQGSGWTQGRQLESDHPDS